MNIVYNAVPTIFKTGPFHKKVYIKKGWYNMITIIGLGAGDLNQMPLGIYKTLKNAKKIFLRTNLHPVVTDLINEGFIFQSFDYIYEKHDNFEDVYEEITQVLIDESAKCDLVYATPGHPMVAEKTVQLLLQSSAEVKVLGGASFLDAMFTSLKIDPVEGFQLLDATEFSSADVAFNQHVIFTQVYNAEMASNIKIPLLDILPYDFEVVIATAVGSSDEVIKKVPLFELDFETELNNLTSVYIPPVDKKLLYSQFSTLRDTVRTLRSPAGCPWDRAQTHESLIKNLREETEELIQSIHNEDDENLIEELGDVLLQVVLHAQIGEDDGFFTIDDVIRSLNEKLIRRHPHVFGGKKAATPEEAIAMWNEVKQQERK